MLEFPFVNSRRFAKYERWWRYLAHVIRDKQTASSDFSVFIGLTWGPLLMLTCGLHNSGKIFAKNITTQSVIFYFR